MSGSATGEEKLPLQVFCRFRPLEIGSHHEQESWSTEGTTIHSLREKSSFTFDRVFGPGAAQCEVFDAIEPLVLGVLHGKNAAVLCYGQSSTGKTYTMEGVTGVTSQEGLIPRALAKLFRVASSANSDSQSGSGRISFQISMLEIHQERLRDLLAPNDGQTSTNLRVVNDCKRGVWVRGLSEVAVGSCQQALQAFCQGRARRVVAAAGQNSTSSRSHSIFIITVEHAASGSSPARSRRLYMADLAGSENAKRRSKVGDGTQTANAELLDEARIVNQSLSTLGLVMSRLAENQAIDGENQAHVPYRDSQLTRVLQGALGGSAQTALVINCSLKRQHMKETLSTMRFGTRARCIGTGLAQEVMLRALKCAQDSEKEAKSLLESKSLLERGSHLPSLLIPPQIVIPRQGAGWPCPGVVSSRSSPRSDSVRSPRSRISSSRSTYRTAQDSDGGSSTSRSRHTEMQGSDTEFCKDSDIESQSSPPESPKFTPSNPSDVPRIARLSSLHSAGPCYSQDFPLSRSEKVLRAFELYAKDFNALNGEHLELQQRYDTLVKEHGQVMQESTQVWNDYMSLTEEFDRQSKKTFKQLQEMDSCAKRKNEKLTMENEKLRADFDLSQKQNEQLVKENQGLLAEIASLRSLVEQPQKFESFTEESPRVAASVTTDADPSNETPRTTASCVAAESDDICPSARSHSSSCTSGITLASNCTNSFEPHISTDRPMGAWLACPVEKYKKHFEAVDKIYQIQEHGTYSSQVPDSSGPASESDVPAKGNHAPCAMQ